MLSKRDIQRANDVARDFDALLREQERPYIKRYAARVGWDAIWRARVTATALHHHFAREFAFLIPADECLALYECYERAGIHVVNALERIYADPEALCAASPAEAQSELEALGVDAEIHRLFPGVDWDCLIAFLAAADDALVLRDILLNEVTRRFGTNVGSPDDIYEHDGTVFVRAPKEYDNG